MSCACLCCLAFPPVEIGWSAVCDYGISKSYSFTFAKSRCKLTCLASVTSIHLIHTTLLWRECECLSSPWQLQTPHMCMLISCIVDHVQPTTESDVCFSGRHKYIAMWMKCLSHVAQWERFETEISKS